MGGAFAPVKSAVSIGINSHVTAACLHRRHQHARLIIVFILVEREHGQNIVSSQLVERRAQAPLDGPAQQVDVYFAGFFQDLGGRILLRRRVNAGDTAPHTVHRIKIEIGGGAPMLFEICLEGLVHRAKLRYDRRFDNHPLVASAFGGHKCKSLPEGQGLFLNVAGSAKQAGLRGKPGLPQSRLDLHSESPCVEALQGRSFGLRGTGAEVGRLLKG